MKEQIPVLDRVPFKGITTIQLYDKDTGKEVQKVVHKNTYNQRLMYFTYLNEIINGYNDSCFFNNIPLYGDWRKSNWSVKYSKVYNASWPIADLGGTISNDNDASTPYACLFLTSDTGAASASGYPDGIPVAVAPLMGISTREPTDYQMGRLNAEESYVGNDRIHFVVDFDTASGNCTFNSLLIYPGTKRGNSIGGGQYLANTVPFYGASKIQESQLATIIDPPTMPEGRPSWYQVSLNAYYINDPYIALVWDG